MIFKNDQCIAFNTLRIRHGMCVFSCKQRIRRFFYTAFAVCVLSVSGLGLVSCQEEIENLNGSSDARVPVAFAPSIGSELTRAVDTTWSGGETVGIAMLPALVSASPDNNTGDGVAYTFKSYKVSGEGTETVLTPKNVNDRLYYPAGNSSVTFLAFSPFSSEQIAVSESSGKPEMTFGGFADQSSTTGDTKKMEAVDFLYYNDETKKYSKSSTDAVKLNFSHKLSKLVIELSTTTDDDASKVYLSKLTGAQVSKLPGSVTIDLTDGTPTPTADVEAVTTEMFQKPSATGTPDPQSASEEPTSVTYEAIVVPHEGKDKFAGRAFTVFYKEANKDWKFEVSLPGNLEFESGKSYTLKYRLTAKGLEQIGTPEITGWKTGSIGWGNYDFKYTNAEDAFKNLSADGETRTISFTTTYPGDKVTAEVEYGNDNDKDWITIENLETTGISNGKFNYTCEFTVKHNIGKEVSKRTANINFPLLDANAYVTVSQSALKYQLASNSYILAPGASIYIPVSRANEHASSAIGAETTFTTELLWMDAQGLIKDPVAFGKGNDGAIKVTAASAPTDESGQPEDEYYGGNAVVAVKVDGTIVWSWHIWVTGYVPDPEVNNGWMDRNLGALSGAKEDGWKTFGLYYQWGRKDPFPGAGSNLDGKPTIYTTTATDDDGTKYAVTAPGDANTMTDRVKNPTTFYTTNITGATTSDNFWGATGGKAIYDPCPAGYRVPVKGSWGTTNSNWSSYSWDDANKGRNATNYGGWYAAAGLRTGSSDELRHVGANGYCWSASPDGKTEGCGLKFDSSYVTPVNRYTIRFAGCGVRCKSEN